MGRYVGLDAHADTRTLAVMGPTGRRLTSRVVATNGHALREALRAIRGGVHLCLEEGTRGPGCTRSSNGQTEEIRHKHGTRVAPD